MVTAVTRNKKINIYIYIYRENGRKRDRDDRQRHAETRKDTQRHRTYSEHTDPRDVVTAVTRSERDIDRERERGCLEQILIDFN